MSTIHRITPDCQPVFPCWLWGRINAIYPSPVEHWRPYSFMPNTGLHYLPGRPDDKLRPGVFLATHWHPDQPEAPTTAPTPAESGRAESLRAVMDKSILDFLDASTARQVIGGRNEFDQPFWIAQDRDKITTIDCAGKSAREALLCLMRRVSGNWDEEPNLPAPVAAPAPGETPAPFDSGPRPPEQPSTSPRTDDVYLSCADRKRPNEPEEILLAHARQLERELNEAKGANKIFADKCRGELIALRQSVARLTQERDALKHSDEQLHIRLRERRRIFFGDAEGIYVPELLLAAAEFELSELRAALQKAREALVSCGEHYGEGPPNTEADVAAIDAALHQQNE